MRPCLKVNTYCTIALEDGTVYEGVNSCDVDGLAECPRVTAGCATGEGYELCKPIHAEIDALEMVPSDNVGGVAIIRHNQNWACGDCQRALVEKGIRTVIIGEWNG